MPPKKPSKPATSKSAPQSASKASAKSPAKTGAKPGAKSGAKPGAKPAAATAKDGPRFWLVKSEPGEFSFDALLAAPKRTAMWDGVRNYQARNTLRHEMAVGDEVLYYHSNSDPMGVVGVARVASAAYPDPTQFERGHVHEDPGSSPSDPRWWVVDVQAVRRLPRVVTLEEMKANPALAGMPLLQRGSRLSVQPVGAEHFAEVLRMASSPA
jgi:predicted RNA-binding protein with PUA-like domain